jgi:hypothetical protein
MPTDKRAGNVTKFVAGGSGDNIVPDGYIKTVEKVWLDSYTGASITGTKGSIDIAILPLNKKLVDVVCLIETTASQTSGSIGLGWSEDAIANQGALFASTPIAHNLTTSTISLQGGLLGGGAVASGFAGPKAGALQTVTDGTRTTISLQFNNWTMSFSTIKTIVRYT